MSELEDVPRGWIAEGESLVEQLEELDAYDASDPDYNREEHKYEGEPEYPFKAENWFQEGSLHRVINEDGEVCGIAVEFPESDVYIDWKRDAFEDELDHAHVSIYGSLEDAAQATNNTFEEMENEAIAKMSDSQLERLFKEWVPYEGPQGGEGWENTRTGEIVYQDEEPGTEEHESHPVTEVVSGFIENAPEPELKDIPGGDIANPAKTQEGLEPRDVPWDPPEWNLPGDTEASTTPIEDLLTSQDSLNSDSLRHAVAILSSGEEMPPIEYVNGATAVSGDFIPVVRDGNHRLVAAWLLGMEEVPTVPGSMFKNDDGGSYWNLNAILDHYVDPETGEIFVKQWVEVPAAEKETENLVAEHITSGDRLYGEDAERALSDEPGPYEGDEDPEDVEPVEEFESWQKFLERAPEPGSSIQEYAEWRTELAPQFAQARDWLANIYGEEDTAARLKEADSIKEKLEDREKSLETMDDFIGTRALFDSTSQVNDAVQQLQEQAAQTEGMQVVEVDDERLDDPGGGYYRGAHVIVVHDEVPTEIQLLSRHNKKLKHWAQAETGLYKEGNEGDPVYEQYASAWDDWIYAWEEGQDPGPEPECPPKLRERGDCFDPQL